MDKIKLDSIEEAIADFREGESENFFESDGWSNSTGTEEGPFNTCFSFWNNPY